MSDGPPTGLPADQETITVYYKSFMSTAYKADEKAVRDVVSMNVTPTNPSSKVKLVVYYRNLRNASLIIRNNTRPPPTNLESSCLVYQFKCPLARCEQQSYIVMTQTTLERRTVGHLQARAIKTHFHNRHRQIITVRLYMKM